MPIDPRRILFEDEHLLVVNKLGGELVVAAEGEGKLPLFDFLRKDRPGLRVVHRLDFQTSGILVFAKTAEAVQIIRDTKFKGWKKTYVALVYGRMEQPSGTIDRKLAARTHDTLIDAVTHYRTLRQFTESAYVEAVIDTGRKHQIRQHLAAIGHPLLRDPLYGNKKADERFARRYGYSRFFLHSSKLTLQHPITGKELHLHAPLPQTFAEALERLGNDVGIVIKDIPASKRRLRPRTRQTKGMTAGAKRRHGQDRTASGRRGRRR